MARLTHHSAAGPSFLFATRKPESDSSGMDRQEAIDQILDHYHHPRNRGALSAPTARGEGINPGCGDVVQMYVRVGSDGRIAAASFEGQGCTISQASASLMTELALGKTLDEILALDDEALIEMLGREVVLSRVRCATLPLDVLKQGIHDYRGEAGPRSAQA